MINIKQIAVRRLKKKFLIVENLASGTLREIGLMKYRIKEYQGIKERVEKMSLHELLEVVTCPNVQISDQQEIWYHTTAILCHAALAEESQRYLKAVRQKAKEPRLFCADLEFGAGNTAIGTTRFPSFMACRAAGGAEYAYQMGKVCAKEAREIGYNWTYSPCVDILFDHNSPIVSTRSAGETAEEVIEIAGAYMRGLQENGIAASLKHFPGDGLCENDQHLTTPENPLSMTEWYATYGKVYKTLIEEGVKAVMPGHISLPAYDEKDEELGMYPPATLSKRLMTDLLKKELGFEGIIISDAVNMGGFCGYMNYYDACCRFLEAGGDLLLFVHLTPVFESKMEKALKDGKLSMETLKDRVYRVLCFAKELEENAKELEERERAETDIQKAEVAGRTEENKHKEHAVLAREITRKACTVVRDRKHNIPFDIKKDTKILHLQIHNNYLEEDVKSLTTELKKISDHVDESINPGPDRLREIAEGGMYDLIVCTVGCRYAFGTNAIKLHGVMARNMMYGWTKYDTPVIFVNHGNPWIGDEYRAIMDTLINTYGCTDYTAEAVVDKITGR